MITPLNRLCLTAAALVSLTGASPKALAVSWPEEKLDQWRGYQRHLFKVDGCDAWVVEPKGPAAGNPWTWCMEFPDAFTERTGVPHLLEKGFYHLHIVVGNTFGCPAALKHFDAFYTAFTQQGLAKKGTLIGISRGGLYAYNWAAKNPDKVACVYGDAPVCDFKSWPGGKGSGKGSPTDWTALIRRYRFANEAEALAYNRNPIDNLGPLLKAAIPIIHVVGDADDVVPVSENTRIVEERYKAGSGKMLVIHKPGIGHHPHGLEDPSPIVQFVLESTTAALRSAQNAPTVLPGEGLREHDFFYAGESKKERMFIVRGGEVVWSYTHNGRGEISDAVLLPNRNVLFAHQYGITEVTQDKNVVWDYDAPPGTEIHTAQLFGENSICFVQNGDPAKVVVMNKGTKAVEHEFVLPTKNPKAVHGQFRHARLTGAGTIMVAHMDLGKAVEYDLNGKQFWAAEVPGVWSATPLTNGNVLTVSTRGFVRELSRDGKIVWEWKTEDAAGYRISNLQLATRLPNGNTLINNWFNEWSGQVDLQDPPVQALEVTPDKKIVWALRSWLPPADLGPSTTIQILDR